MNNPKLLQAMFEEATIGILIVNVQGDIVEINPYTKKLFGFERDELIGNKVEILLPDSFKSRHIQHRDNYHKNPVPRAMGANLELYGQRKDGTQFPIEISLSYMKLEGEQFAIAYVSDDTLQKTMLTELKEQEKKILDYSDHLEQKVEERTKELHASEAKLKESLQKEKDLGELKSRFVSMASHEFRTPLSSILSSANLIGRYEKEEQQVKRMKHVNRIESSVRNLTVILNDFLSLEKLESGKVRYSPVELNFAEYVQQIIDEVSLTAKEGQKIIHTHKGDDKVFIDEHLIKNILINLLSNGIKYSLNGGDVVLMTENVNTLLKMQVKDSGIGIPEKEQQHMFTRFFRANNVETIQGTGLGLTIVKRYLDLMNGSISFKSKEGEGTTFFLEIPISI